MECKQKSLKFKTLSPHTNLLSLVHSSQIVIPLSFLYIFSWFETNLDHRPFSCVALVVEPVVHLGILEWRDFLSEIQKVYPDLNLL